MAPICIHTSSLKPIPLLSCWTRVFDDSIIGAFKVFVTNVRVRHFQPESEAAGVAGWRVGVVAAARSESFHGAGLGHAVVDHLQRTSLLDSHPVPALIIVVATMSVRVGQ